METQRKLAIDGNDNKSFKLRSEIIPLTDGNGWRHSHMTRINWLVALFALSPISLAAAPLSSPVSAHSRASSCAAQALPSRCLSTEYQALKSCLRAQVVLQPCFKLKLFKLFFKSSNLFLQIHSSQAFPQNLPNIPCSCKTIKKQSRNNQERAQVQWWWKPYAPSKDEHNNRYVVCVPSLSTSALLYKACPTDLAGTHFFAGHTPNAPPSSPSPSPSSNRTRPPGSSPGSQFLLENHPPGLVELLGAARKRCWMRIGGEFVGVMSS
ncbi:hypothetical protein C8R45DRAFT_1115070 [Mycena sanguinolenta]|nr:hypothetical protein C8R45DRAFT_1115070 [Mycena sanguinolenta]